MSTVGRIIGRRSSKEDMDNTLINYYGSVPGVEVGDCWHQRRDLIDSSVHKSRSRLDIGGEGPYSILLTGVKNIKDQGYTFVFSSGELEKEDGQEPERPFNKSMMQAYHSRNPFRIVRGSYLKSPYAPDDGFRYDGLYICQSFARESYNKGKSIFKFVMSRRLGEPPASWLYDKSDFRPIVVNTRCIRLQRPLTEEEKKEKEKYEKERSARLLQIKKEIAAADEMVEIVSEEPREIQMDEALDFPVIIEESVSLEGTEFIEQENDLSLSFRTKKEENSSLEEIDLVEDEEEHFGMETLDGDRIVVDTESSEGDAPQPVEMYMINNDNDVVVMKHSPNSGLITRQEEVSYYETNSPCLVDLDPLSIKSPMSQLQVIVPDSDSLFNVPTNPLLPFIPVADNVMVIKPPSSVPPCPEDIVSDCSDGLYKQEDHDYMLPEWYSSVKKTPSPPLVCCTCCLSKRSIISILGHSKAELFNSFHKRYFCNCGASTDSSQRFQESLPMVHTLLTQLWSKQPMDMVKLVIFLVQQLQQVKDVFRSKSPSESSSIKENTRESIIPQEFPEESSLLQSLPVSQTPIYEEDSAVFMILRDVDTGKLYSLEEHNNSFRLAARLEKDPPSVKRKRPELPICLDFEEEVQMKRPKVIEPTTVLRKFPGRKRRGRRPKVRPSEQVSEHSNQVQEPSNQVPEPSNQVPESSNQVPASSNQTLDMKSFFGACDGLIESMLTRSLLREPKEYLRRKSNTKVDFRANLRGFTYFDIKKSAMNLQKFRVLYPYDDDHDCCDGYTSGEIYLAKENFTEFKNIFKGYRKSVSPPSY